MSELTGDGALVLVFPRLIKHYCTYNDVFSIHAAAARQILSDISGGTFVWPLVRWDTGAVTLMKPHRFDVQTEDEEVLAVRYQLAVLLADAFTVHKAQGMTLRYVYAAMAKAFCSGQIYVAYSRTKLRDNLSIDVVPNLPHMERAGKLVDVDALEFLARQAWRRVTLPDPVQERNTLAMELDVIVIDESQ